MVVNNKSPFLCAWIRSHKFLVPDGCTMKTEMIILAEN